MNVRAVYPKDLGQIVLLRESYIALRLGVKMRTPTMASSSIQSIKLDGLYRGGGPAKNQILYILPSSNKSPPRGIYLKRVIFYYWYEITDTRHMKNNNFIVIALGGSILVSEEVQVDYIRRLYKFLINKIESGHKFVLVIGGGSVARQYQDAASRIVQLNDDDKDWLGIHATRLNAHLLRTIFASHAYPVVLDDPDKVIEEDDIQRYAMFIGSGWRPGNSTDYIAFRLAQRFGSDTVLVATKISYVYDKDVDMHDDARPLKELSWDEYIAMVGEKWIPGMKAPVDPVAAQFARDNNMSCVLLRGTDLENFDRYLEGEDFEGSTIVS